MIRRLILLRWTLLIFVIFAVGCGGGSGTSKSDPQVRAELQKILDDIRERAGVPGMTLYVKSKSLGEYRLASGTGDLETGAPLKPDTVFRIGSLTKTFTGAAVVLLAERGLIELTAPAQDYLPIPFPFLEQITVQDVLHMSSGIAPYLNENPVFIDQVLAEPGQSYQPKELIDTAYGITPELRFTPGSWFEYTNTNYVLLGMMIEQVSGRSYEKFIEEEFLKPLGLKDTKVTVNEPFTGSKGYFDSKEDGSYEDWTAMDMSYVWSAGCMSSNARDIGQWIEAYTEGRFLSRSSMEQLTVGVQTNDGENLIEGAFYTAGLLDIGNYGMGHNGTVLGYHADAWNIESAGAVIVVLSNTNTPLGEDIDHTKAVVDDVANYLNSYAALR